MVDWDGGARALREGTKARAAFKAAREGLATGDVEKLAMAKSEGWSPSMGGSKEWFALAMCEPTGASARWLLSAFALDAVESPVFAHPTECASGQWSCAAMLAVERLAMGVGGELAWARACSESREARDYFAKSLAGGAWLPGGARSDPWAGLVALLVPPLACPSEAVAKMCAEFAAREARRMDPAARRKAGWEGAVAKLARALLDAQRPLEPMGSLLADLPESQLRMGLAPVEVQRRGRSADHRRGRGRGIEDWASSARPGNLEGAKEPGPLGASALLGASMANFEWALSKGWIAPVRVELSQKCEWPDFVAWDEARVTKDLGRHVDMEDRWAKCREIIESSALPAGERERLLGRCLARDPGAWEPGGPEVFEVTRVKMASPMSALLAAGARGRAEEALLEPKAKALAAAGWRMKEALSVDDPFGKEAREASRRLPWAARMAERDELEDASASGPPSRRARSL